MSGNDEIVTYPPGGEFAGTIGNTVEESSPAWPVPKKAPPDSPNVIFYVLDDVGYGQLEPFGGLIEAPMVARLAEGGLRYTNMHTTALCSPSRSCIITGRNHHSNGMGSISEWTTGYPGYNGRIPLEHGFISEILKAEGYNTYAAGKWHLAVPTEEGPAGPFDTWPLGRGFQRYYGFLPGETDQWYPDLISDNHAVEPPAAPEDGYHFSADLADTAIKFISDSHINAPNKPFFLYLCPGAGHAPHHVFKEWADRYKGKFDMGWDKYREIVVENQRKLGVIPPDTELSPRDPDVPEWDSLSDDEKRLYTRMMEVMAGYVTYTEHQMVRLLDFLESVGKLDNTLIMFVSDNGASPEGGEVGSMNEFNFFNNLGEDLQENLARIDELGGPNSYNHYAWGWAHAGNTPFKRWKKEIYRGGTSDPFIVHWPAGIDAAGEIRHQFGHVVDMVPTVLDALGIDPPDTLNGHEQKPFEGVSFAHTFDDANTETKHHTQYYEMFAGRSIYHDGWRAVCGWPGPNFTEGAAKGRHQQDPLHPADLADLEANGWELYHVATDYAEVHDVAEKHPQMLRQLIDLWWTEARKYNVLPLDGTINQRFAAPRPSDLVASDKTVLYPGAPLFALAQPNLFNRSYVMTADVHIPDDGAEGVIVATGGGTGGFALYVKDGKVGYVYNYLANKYFHLRSDVDTPTGDVEITLEFERTGDPDIRAGKGAPGRATLLVNGEHAGSVDMDVTVPLIFSAEGMSLARDTGDSVSKEIYLPPFPFTGTVRSVTFDTSGDAIDDAEAKARRAMAKQ